MNLLVFAKRVPATQEEELRILGDGAAVDLSRVPFKVNDWDAYAIEEAVRTVEKTGGAVTAVSMGDAESDEVLRRAIAMGAKDGSLIETEQVVHDPHFRAGLICNFLKKEALPYDAIFTGVQSEDDQFAAVGGILAAKLGLPYASMVIGIDAVAGRPRGRAAGARGGPAGAHQGRPACCPLDSERHQRAALRLHHGGEEGVQGGAEGIQGGSIPGRRERHDRCREMGLSPEKGRGGDASGGSRRQSAKTCSAS